MTTSYTTSPKKRRTSSTTCSESFVRGSNIVITMPGESELRVDVLLDQADVPQELSQALERVVLALDRHDQLLRGREGVDRQQAERGRAVEEDEVVAALPDGAERLLESRLAGELADQLDLRARPDRSCEGTASRSFTGVGTMALVDRGLRHDDVVRRSRRAPRDGCPCRWTRCPAGRGRRRGSGSRARRGPLRG